MKRRFWARVFLALAVVSVVGFAAVAFATTPTGVNAKGIYYKFLKAYAPCLILQTQNSTSTTKVLTIQNSAGAENASIMASGRVTANEIALSKTITASGTPQTINKASGQITIPSTQTSFTIADSLVSTATLGFGQVANATTNAVYVKSVVCTSNQIVITLSGDPGTSGAVVSWYLSQ